MTIVSVVVPVYNTAKYLERCITGLLNQSLKEIEIILVDDGSTDNSGSLCDLYAEKHDQICVIHKQNGGLSSARNAGMKRANGEYIGFVDSDDTVGEEMYSEMLSVIVESKTDFVMTDYYRVRSDGTKYIKTLDINYGRYDKRKIEKEIFPQLIMKSNLQYGPLLSVCHCLYRKSFLEKYNLFFDEEVKWSEDNLFSSKVGYYASSFYYLKGKAYYYYFQNQGTITTSYKEKAWKVYKTMNNHLHLFFDDSTEYDFHQQLKWHLLFYACNCLRQTVKICESERIRKIKEILYDKKLTEAFKNVNLKDIGWKLRIQLFLMKHKQVLLLSKVISRGSR